MNGFEGQVTTARSSGSEIVATNSGWRLCCLRSVKCKPSDLRPTLLLHKITSQIQPAIRSADACAYRIVGHRHNRGVESERCPELRAICDKRSPA